jgi:pimeloyl-ACP methyl ester carboxylesterase
VKKNKNMLKRLSIFSLIISIALAFTKCYAFKKYMRSDEELAVHYQSQAVKPRYKSVPVDQRLIHYAVIAKSDTLPLLVFVHGAPGAWYGYQNLMDDTTLQRRYKMISVDRLGYGKSGYGKPELSTEMQANSIKTIIEEENHTGKKIVLMGRSYGAPITALVAIEHPEIIEKLFMISPVIDPEKEKFFWFSKAGNWKPVQMMLPQLLNVATAEKFAHENEMKKMLPKWDYLCVPTTVITGDADKIADTANFTFARKHLTHCDTTLLRLKNTGHLVTYEQPEIIKNLLLKEENRKPLAAAIH